MTWTKTGDEFADECWTLSDAAYRLHHEGLTWSNRKGTDGQLAKDDMIRWARRPEAAEELVDIGWWEDHGQHFQIIHHIGYQRTREQVAKQSQANRANRAKGKSRPVKKTEPLNEPSDESSNELTDERDRTGQARTGSTQPDEKNETSTHEKPDHNGVHPGCACGRPAPVNAHTGLCEWCQVKQRRAEARGGLA